MMLQPNCFLYQNQKVQKSCLISISGSEESIAVSKIIKKIRWSSPNPKGIINRDITPNAKPKCPLECI